MTRLFAPSAAFHGLLLALVGWSSPAFANGGDPLAEVQALYQAGRAGDALRKVDVVIAARPGDPRPRFQKGVMLVDQKRPNEAIQIFQKLVQDFPALPEPMNNLAVLYVERGDMEKARTTLESAIRSKPNYGTAFQNLGDLYTRMASKAYARALQIDEPEGAPKLALIRNLYEVPELKVSDALISQASVTPATPVVTKAPVSVAPLPAPASAQATAAPPGVPSVASSPMPAARPPAAAGVVPAVKPATVAASAAAVAKSATKPAVKGPSDDAEVAAAVRAWAAAWSRRDVPGYFAAYQPGFKGSDASSEAWQAARKVRIVGKAAIKVEVSALKIDVDNGVAKASFRQSYSAGALDVNSRKTLELVKTNGRWLIRRESVGG